MRILVTCEATSLSTEVDQIIAENRRILADVEVRFQSRCLRTTLLLYSCAGRLERSERAVYSPDPFRCRFR
jgi:hypothetical protein